MAMGNVWMLPTDPIRSPASAMRAGKVVELLPRVTRISTNVLFLTLRAPSMSQLP